MKREAGMTLLNIMTAMAIMAIGLALTGPNISQMMAKNRFEIQANDFLISLSLARSEAIKRNINVTLCPSTNGTSCAAKGNWNRGWIISDANGTLLKVYPKAAGTISIVGASGTDYETSITFTPSGRPLSQGDLVLCYKDSSGILSLVTGRTVSVSPTGRPEMEKNADHVGTITTTFTSCNGT